MYIFIKIRHNLHTKGHGNDMMLKKFNYMLDIDILRNSSQKYCSMILARKDLKTNLKKKGKIVGPFSELEQVPVVFMMLTRR